MLNGMGISTGVKLEKILEVSKYINRYLNRMPSSRVAMANFNK